MTFASLRCLKFLPNKIPQKATAPTKTAFINVVSIVAKNAIVLPPLLSKIKFLVHHSIWLLYFQYFYALFQVKLLKIHLNITNLCYGCYSHIWSIQTNPRSNNIVHIPFFQISVGILPYDFRGEVQREDLSIMSMST